jgi:hypothetical protein
MREAIIRLPGDLNAGGSQLLEHALRRPLPKRDGEADLIAPRLPLRSLVQPLDLA